LIVDVVCSSRELFGSDRSGLRLAQALKTLGHEPRLKVPEHRPEHGLGSLADAAGIPYLPESAAIVTGRGIELPRRVSPPRHRADVTIANTTAVAWIGHRGTRYVQVVREWLDPSDVRHRLLARHLARRADALVTISTGVARQWTACSGGSQADRIIHNWLESSWLRDASEVPLDGRAGIVCVGRFNRWKGQAALADAYEVAFDGERDPPEVTFIGAEGPESPFFERAEQIRSRAPGDRWKLVPVTPDPSHALRRASLLVLPSLRPEPFGNVLLEALAMGCRVIAFNGGGPDDLRDKFPRALQVVSREGDSLAAALRDWWTSGGKPQSRADRDPILNTLVEHYGPERGTRDWESLLGRAEGLRDR
jgi:glycosyltransferase involved in cell wall biosynthesis